MTTELIKYKSQKGLEHEQKAIQKLDRVTIFVQRGATGLKGIKRIDKQAMKKYIETEGYGE